MNGSDIKISCGEHFVVTDDWASDLMRNGKPLDDVLDEMRAELLDCGNCEIVQASISTGIKTASRLVDDVLDKIRAKIECLTITKGGEDYIRKMAELYSLKIKVLQIIDKYKESEVEKCR